MHLFLKGEYEPRIRTTVEEELVFWSKKYIINIQFFYYKKKKKEKEKEKEEKEEEEEEEEEDVTSWLKFYATFSKCTKG